MRKSVSTSSKRLAVDRVLALARGEIVDEGEEIHLALPVGRQHGQFLDHLEAGDAGQFEDVAAVAGLGELGDAPDAADAEQRRPRLVSRMRGVGLDHPDQPVAVAKRVVDHGEIARLENVERHLAARQQQRAGQRKHGNQLRKLAGSAIFGIDRHRRSKPSRC